MKYALIFEVDGEKDAAELTNDEVRKGMLHTFAQITTSRDSWLKSVGDVRVFRSVEAAESPAASRSALKFTTREQVDVLLRALRIACFEAEHHAKKLEAILPSEDFGAYERKIVSGEIMELRREFMRMLDAVRDFAKTLEVE